MAKYKVPPLHYNPPTKHDKYYEATIQFRNPPQEVINILNKDLQKDPELYCAGIAPHKDGFDMLISSQRYARNFGTRVKRAFKKVDLKISKKIFSRDRQSSREIYRATVLLRFDPPEEKSE